MNGIKGTAQLNNLTGILDLNLDITDDILSVSVHPFPVIHGDSAQPCDVRQIGSPIFPRITSVPLVGKNAMVNVTDQLKLSADLADLSIAVMASHLDVKACGTLGVANATIRTARAKCFGNTVAGTIYLRQDSSQASVRLLSDLQFLSTDRSVPLAVLLAEGRCDEIKEAAKKELLKVRIGERLSPLKSRGVVNASWDEIIGKALVIVSVPIGCADVHEVTEVETVARMNTKGVRGSVAISQSSMFEPSRVVVSLQGLNQNGGGYHVHNYPVPPRLFAADDVCANANTGGHWDPFGISTGALPYPTNTNSTHDMYEVGDLSGRHGNLNEVDEILQEYDDWNLPMFGVNLIMGRSLVIHYANGARWLCATLQPVKETIMAAAIFTSPIVGRILLQQFSGDPYADVSIFTELAHANNTIPFTSNHKWHAHRWPIQSASDLQPDRCASVGGHFNPYQVPVYAAYASECQKNNTFLCEAGDFSGKHGRLDVPNDLALLSAKHFFTDTTVSLLGRHTIVNRSVMLHALNGGASRFACANVTILRPIVLVAKVWRGTQPTGSLNLTQVSPFEHATVQINFPRMTQSSLLHIHSLPLPGSIRNDVEACSEANVGELYNPFNVSAASVPPPGNGTVDQYAMGDLSGKSGLIPGPLETKGRFEDPLLQLAGQLSVFRRTVVVRSTSGTSVQCSNLQQGNIADGKLLKATATFSGNLFGNITMTQLVFPDGSVSDTSIEVDLKNNNEKLETNLCDWQILELSEAACSNPSDVFNPYMIETGKTSACSPRQALHCAMGDMTGRQASLRINQRQLFSDILLRISGDATVVGQVLAVRSATKTASVLGCEKILPGDGVPMRTLVFSNHKALNRHELRSAVAGALHIPLWRVNILSGSHYVQTVKGCQSIGVYMAGHVNAEDLETLPNKLGDYSATEVCKSSQTSIHGPTVGVLLMAALLGILILC
uniref:uncharacterized protein n=1 Tax=Myxine glutinosa TaxID=7769 RepID=UPI00359026BF